MARPISWQSDLSSIHRRVTESPRSPYHREDLEKLFGIASRAAQNLMELMRRTRMANIQVVEREHLLEFLAGALDAEDLRGYLDELRKNPPKASRRKLRLAIPQEFEPGDLKTLQRGHVWLERGKVVIDFTTLPDAMAKIYQLIRVLDDPAFEKRYCEPMPTTVQSTEQIREAHDLKRIRAEAKYLHKIESAREALRRRTELLDEHMDDEAAVMTEIAKALRSEAAEAIDQARQLCIAIGIEDDQLSSKAEAILAELFIGQWNIDGNGTVWSASSPEQGSIVPDPTAVI